MCVCVKTTSLHTYKHMTDLESALVRSNSGGGGGGGGWSGGEGEGQLSKSQILEL